MKTPETFPSEIRTFTDSRTGRTIRQLTAGIGDEYHIYYQAYPYTADGRYLVFYSRRDGRTDLYRLDRADGTITRLTRGTSTNTGWWPWTPMQSEGVYDYISALDPQSGEVYYHDRDELRAVNVRTLVDRPVARGPAGYRPLSQLTCAWSGRFVLTVWALQEQCERAAVVQQAALDRGEPFRKTELNWRDIVQSRLDCVNVQTGEITTLTEVDMPLHNLAIDPTDRYVLAVTAPEKPGSIMMVDIQSPGKWRLLESPENLGYFCHFHVGRNGCMLFDSNVQDERLDLVNTYLGSVELDGSDCKAWAIGANSYCHIGHDRKGKLIFGSIDNHNDATGHHIAIVRPCIGGNADLLRLTDNLPSGRNQLCHAHPVLSPNRESILYTSLGADDRTHLFEVDISELDLESLHAC